MKNPVEGLNRNLNQQKKEFVNLYISKDYTIGRRERKKEWRINSPANLGWGTAKWPNIHIMGALQEKGKNGTEKISQEIMSENFPKSDEKLYTTKKLKKLK